MIAHNATTIRNLAEIRHRENVPLVENQYKSVKPMAMQPVDPEPLPVSEGQEVVADIKDVKKPKALSVGEKMRQKLKGRASEKQPVQVPEMPASWSPFTNFMAAEPVAAGPLTKEQEQAQETPQAKGKSPVSSLVPTGEKTATIEKEQESTETQKTTGATQASVQQKDAKVERTGTQPPTNQSKTDVAEAEKPKSSSKFTNMFKRTQKSKEKELTMNVEAAASSMSKLSAEATKAAADLKRIQENIPQIKVGEGPPSKEAKEDAIKRYQSILETGGSDPFTMLMAAEDFGALDAITEMPPVRTHSLSEDTALVAKQSPQQPHDLSADTLVSSGRAAPAHTLAQDKIINAKPSRRGGHRLSADAMVPVRVAAPGHYLDADPTVSSPQQLFPHELLEDVRVLRPRPPPQEHNLELDKKLAMLQNQSQPHGLHSDTVLPAPKARSAHDLHSDQVVVSGASAHGAHDLTHDVRILSPSGQVHEPHSLDDDDIIKETAVFRKSPHPDVMMPGNWAPSPSSGGEAGEMNNPMASLNASLQSAGQALGELNQATRPTSPGKENAVAGTLFTFSPPPRPYLPRLLYCLCHIHMRNLCRWNVPVAHA